jgi:FixJ family two-component response regulator
MPKVEGLDLILVLKKRFPELPIIAISGTGQMAGAINTWSRRKLGPMTPIPSHSTMQKC